MVLQVFENLGTAVSMLTERMNAPLLQVRTLAQAAKDGRDKKKQQFGTPAKTILKKGTASPRVAFSPKDSKSVQLPNCELYKEAMDRVIECNLCVKLGVGAPANNHIVSKCPELRNNITMLSGPSHVPNGNHQSIRYVQPSGSAQGNITIGTGSGTDFASALFRTEDRSFGFTATAPAVADGGTGT
eukprot:806992-Rhodomonas_salina.1